VPGLEGARAAIQVAKMRVDLGVDASGLAFPGERPAKWRRRKTF
jgi:allantoin racemase